MAELKKAIGRSRVYIIPHTAIEPPSESPAASLMDTSTTPSAGTGDAASASASPTISQGTPPTLPTTSRALASLAVPEVSPSPASYRHKASPSVNSQETSLDPAEWLNAGTPEVFYRRAAVEQQSRTPAEFLIDLSEDEIEEEDDIVAVPFTTAADLSEEMDLASILRTCQEEHCPSDVVNLICIRRKKLLESALKAISRSALDQKKFFKCGNLIAWSIAHGGPGLKALDPCLYQLMCGQEPPIEQFDWRVLPDPDVQNKLQRVNI
ncbi:uncharacterized protein V6R79_023110 [Siganus canaliculatus]